MTSREDGRCVHDLILEQCAACCEHSIPKIRCPICHKKKIGIVETPPEKEKDNGIPLEWYAARFFGHTTPDLDPEELMRTARQEGKQAKYAFGDLMCFYWPKADRIPQIANSTPDDAEDAKQNGFIEAYKYRAGYKEKHNGRTRKVWYWLQQIIKNESRNLYRKKPERHEPSLDDETYAYLLEQLTAPGDATTSPQRIIERQEAKDELERALGRIEKTRARAIRLQIDGFKIVEIATRMRKTESATKKLLERGKDDLAEIQRLKSFASTPGTNEVLIQFKTKRRLPSEKDLRKEHKISEAVRKSREGLARETQKIFSLRLQGHRVQQIAEQLAITEADARNNLRVAYTAIRQSIKAEGIRKPKPGAIYFLKN